MLISDVSLVVVDDGYNHGQLMVIGEDKLMVNRLSMMIGGGLSGSWWLMTVHDG